jgi:hypothetical protein
MHQSHVLATDPYGNCIADAHGLPRLIVTWTGGPLVGTWPAPPRATPRRPSAKLKPLLTAVWRAAVQPNRMPDSGPYLTSLSRSGHHHLTVVYACAKSAAAPPPANCTCAEPDDAATSVGRT